ncbi:MAG TPA: SRPBCC family protein [Pyrinomonadaceae bacterium]
MASTPEKVFNALIDPQMTRRYWVNHHNASDWKPGSRWEHRDFDDPAKVDIVGEVIENDPPRKLVVSWVPPKQEGQAEKTSRVTYDVEPFMGIVRLTVTHDELEPDSDMLQSVSFGWPMVVSGLKTLLETGTIGAAAGKRPENCG